MRVGPARPADRVLMVRLVEPAGARFLGALEDGTVFERDPAAGWRVIADGGDQEASFDLMVAVVAASESQGGRVSGGPVEFGFDRGSCDEIREDRFGSVSDMLMVAWDMAVRTGGGPG